MTCYYFSWLQPFNIAFLSATTILKFLKHPINNTNDKPYLRVVTYKVADNVDAEVD
jgi:hypothetical protein